MLKRCWQARWNILLGFIIFLVTLALITPLHFVWRYLELQIDGLAVRFSQIRGTIWPGRAQIKIQLLPVLGPIDSQWHLQFLPLLTGQAKVLLTLEGQDIRLVLPTTLDSNTITIERADGFLELSSLIFLLCK